MNNPFVSVRPPHIEAINIYHRIDNTEDLSTCRGSSYLLLQAFRCIHKKFKALSNSHQALEITNTPPRLLRFIRRSVLRIQKPGPYLATTLKLDSLARIKAEEQIGHASTDDHLLKTIDWKYGSRTTLRSILRFELTGQIHYPLSIPANINALLHWKSWPVHGQNTAIGKEIFYVKDTMK